MPQESLLKLTEYRFQRKSSINTSGHLNSCKYQFLCIHICKTMRNIPLATGNDQTNTGTPTRRRIIEVVDSDSDCDVNEVTTNSHSIQSTSNNTNSTESKKSESIAEKELKVQYLIKMFPTAPAFVSV